MAGVLRLLGALGGAVQQSGSESPEAVVRLAQAALEGDSSAVVAARWRRRLERSPGDRLATLGAATVARLTYDYLAAESLYARAMAPGNGPDIGRIAAHARLGLGIAFRARGLQGLADTTFAATAELAHAAADTALEAEALTWLAVVRARTAGPTAARELLPRAGRLIRSADLRLRALHHCVHAEILVLASHPGALAEASAGADLAGRAVEPRIRAGCLQLIAADLDRRGQVDSALQVYAEVIRDRRAARDRAGLASALQWRGFLLRTVGVLGQARHDLVEAVGEGEASANSAAVAWALSNLAAIALAVGTLRPERNTPRAPSSPSPRRATDSGAWSPSGCVRPSRWPPGSWRGCAR